MLSSEGSHFMRSSSDGFPTMHAPGNPAARWNSSKATRRAVRRAAALADEMKMHSFRVHVDGTVTYTLFNENLLKAKPEAKVKPARGEANDSQVRERRQRGSSAATRALPRTTN